MKIASYAKEIADFKRGEEMGFSFYKVKNNPPFDDAELKQQERALKEFEEICRPVVEYIQKKHTPHTRITIDWASAVLCSEEMGTPYEVPD